MTGPPAQGESGGRQASRINRGIALSLGTAVTAVLTSTVAEVMATKLSQLDIGVVSAVLDRRVLWAVAWLALVALVGLIVLRRAVPRPRPTGLPVLPPRAALVGRDDLVRRVVAEARRTRVVVVHGPAGIGASAVAINAAWELSAAGGGRRYVDLRGADPDPRRAESPRRVAIRVLRSLGVAPGRFRDLDRAGETVAGELRRGQRVLVLDNVQSIDQIGWLLRRITHGYVIAAGDLAASSAVPSGAAWASVGPLEPTAALALLRAQDPGPVRPRRRLDRLLSRLRHETRPTRSVADRIEADRRAADDLAKRYLKHPRVAILIGRWLAANPHISIRMLLEDLARGKENAELLVILRHQLDGASAGARRLLALLVEAPLAELTEAAAAALAGVPVDRTSGHLKELADRSLVEWTRPSRCRVPKEARQLADPVRPALRTRSLARLAAHFADISDTHAEAITPGRPEDQRARAAVAWFEAEDVTLLQVLRMPDPPRKAGPHLWRIADALEAWFGREGRGSDRHAAAAALTSAAKALGDNAAQAIGLLRLSAIAAADGAFEVARDHLDQAEQCRGKSDRWPPLPQYEAGRAVWDLVTGDNDAAEIHLERCRKHRPRRDSTGRLIDLINLAVLRAQKDDYDAAHDYLIQVLDLAEDTDPGAYAHARELLGVVAWRRGHEEQARGEWTAAVKLYQEQGDDLGQARCLQHKAITLLGGAERDLARADLDRSLELRGTGIGLGAALAHLYLGADTAAAGRPEETDRHRAAGLAALSPWAGQPMPPPQVAEIRARLEAL
ncbi:MAG TPA: tetratricopeptide repeat protein [Streptosporangiaceae bacterium]|jgi:tetratricopeptide (TPR) repeat protein|nr:tetratricopeptide repeat protein [Streptosporangiaceae bacterium]